MSNESLKLYYFPGNASLAPHILLEELGVPFELVLVDRDNKAEKSAEYLKLNPAGVIPTLVDGDLVVCETAAILMHLADKFAEKGWIPPLQSAERAHCYRWLTYLTNTVQAEFLHYFYSDRHGGDDAAMQEAVKQRAAARLGDMFDLLDRALADSGGPFLLRAQHSIADIFLFMMCRWSRGMANPARNRPHLAKLVAMMVARPGVANAITREALPQPWY